MIGPGIFFFTLLQVMVHINYNGEDACLVPKKFISTKKTTQPELNWEKVLTEIVKHRDGILSDLKILKQKFACPEAESCMVFPVKKLKINFEKHCSERNECRRNYYGEFLKSEDGFNFFDEQKEEKASPLEYGEKLDFFDKFKGEEIPEESFNSDKWSFM